jgi:uncharacterized protein
MSKRSIVHIEIPAADRHATAEFYKQMFDWDYQHIADPVPYTMSGEGHVTLGYTEPRDDFQVGSPLLYVASDHIDEDLKRAEELGGRIIQPEMEIPGMGWFGIFTDPTGNTIGLFHMQP